MRKIFFLVYFLAAAAGSAAVDKRTKPTCAILTFDARAGMSTDEADLLSDRFMIELDKLRRYTIVSRSKMNEVLKLQQFSRSDSCSASECAIEAGQILGVQFMIYGSLGKIGSLYTMNSYLIDVETGATEKSATTDHHGGIEDMLTIVMASNAKKLLEITTAGSENSNQSTALGNIPGGRTTPWETEPEPQVTPSYFEFNVFPREAVLYLNGKRITASKTEIQPGIRYRITAKLRGYISYYENVDVEDGRTKKIDVILRRKTPKKRTKRRTFIILPP